MRTKNASFTPRAAEQKRRFFRSILLFYLFNIGLGFSCLYSHYFTIALLSGQPYALSSYHLLMLKLFDLLNLAG